MYKMYKNLASANDLGVITSYGHNPQAWDKMGQGNEGNGVITGTGTLSQGQKVVVRPSLEICVLFPLDM